jgi:dihydroneopterin aldolase
MSGLKARLDGVAMDRVLLSGVRCALRVGVAAEERRTPQDILVDVELGRDLSPALRSDDVRDTIDYGQVFELVQGLAREEEFALLERFAGRLEEELRRSLHYESLVIRVKKLRPPLPGSMDFAGIEIRRP